MKIGLTGLPGSGKTTIFNALTRSNVPVGSFTNLDAEPNQAIISVPDERIDRLAELYNPRKTVNAVVEILDFPANSDRESNTSSLSANTIREIRNMDAIGIVTRNFHDSLNGEPDLINDIKTISGELILSDLMIVETRLERIQLQYQRGQKSIKLENEEKVLKKILAKLDNNETLIDLELDQGEEKLIRGFQFLTRKPFLIIINSSEDNFASNSEDVNVVLDQYNGIEFAGKFEMELAQIDDPEEIRMFMDDMGIKNSARDRLTIKAYDILGYISFFTVGDDEVRAWNIIKGTNAVTAAGTIHTDLARGFIRAECFTFDDLLNSGSEKAVRQAGKFRLEGKEYTIQDGDILGIRFNV